MAIFNSYVSLPEGTPLKNDGVKVSWDDFLWDDDIPSYSNIPFLLFP